MVNPVPGRSIGTPYGRRGTYWGCNRDSAGRGIHTGADWPAPAGTRVVAAIDGQIRHRNYGSAFGNHQFAISPDPGQPFAAGEVFYAHCRTRLPDGTRVKAGDTVGQVGAEGNVTGPHLHLEFHPSVKGRWFCSVVADPAPVVAWQPATATIAKGTVLLSKLTYGQRDSDSVKRLQAVLNGHKLQGGQELPVTGNYGAETDEEVRLCQAQHGFGADPPRESYVGPAQAAHLFGGSGHRVVDDVDEPEPPDPKPPSGVPAPPDRELFKPGARSDAFTWMGRRFLAWLPDTVIAKAGAVYTPGPVYSTYDDENVRLVQVAMGNTPDAAGEAYLGERQWTRLAGDPPDTPVETPTQAYVWQDWLADAVRAEGCTVVEETAWRRRGRWNSAGDLAEPPEWDFNPTNGVLWHHTANSASVSRPWPTGTILRDGRADLPGPLCHLSPDFTGVVHVVAAGRANHAGKSNGFGHTVEGDGNVQTFGIEIDYSGLQALPLAQYEASIKCAAAICRRNGWDASYAVAHAETSVTGKWDPGAGTGSARTANMVAWRADLAACLALPAGVWRASRVPDGGVVSVGSGAADHTKHGSVGPFTIPPGQIVAVDPESRKGIRPFITGPAVVAVKVNFEGLPAPGKGRPTRVSLWCRRTADGELANATGTGDQAVPVDDVSVFRAVWVYLTYLETLDPVTFHLEHNGAVSLRATLEQTQVIALVPWKA